MLKYIQEKRKDVPKAEYQILLKKELKPYGYKKITLKPENCKLRFMCIEKRIQRCEDSEIPIPAIDMLLPSAPEQSYNCLGQLPFLLSLMGFFCRNPFFAL